MFRPRQSLPIMSFSRGGPSEGDDTSFSSLVYVGVKAVYASASARTYASREGYMSWGQLAPVVTDNL